MLFRSPRSSTGILNSSNLQKKVPTSSVSRLKAPVGIRPLASSKRATRRSSSQLCPSSIAARCQFQLTAEKRRTCTNAQSTRPRPEVPLMCSMPSLRPRLRLRSGLSPVLLSSLTLKVSQTLSLTARKSVLFREHSYIFFTFCFTSNDY